CIVVLIVSIPAITLLWKNQQKTVREQAHIRAQAIYQMIVVTRQWVADNRDAVDPVPAVVTKELAKYADHMATFKFHITSDRLVNPENAPNNFEKYALKKIENENLLEYADVHIDDNKNKFYRYAAPLYINQSCLACHNNQDYRIDDVRGLISIEFPLEEMENSIASSNKITSYAVIIGLIILIVSISFSVYILVIRHLRTLQKAADAMRQGVREETSIKTDDEIENLSLAFDQMSLQLVNNEEILKNNLQQAVSKYIDLVKELELKNEKLDSLNNLKSDLLDSVAHEIRTPLTKILSYSELLNDERVLEQANMREKFTSALKHNVNVLKNMFNDIITLSRLEHDQHTYHPIPIQIEYLIQDLIYNNEIDIVGKNLQIIQNIEPYTINVDGETFSIAISNILSNAIKYSKESGIIEINSRKESDNYILTFKDYGIGVTQEDMSKLFERFHRGANAKKEYPGTGLGLSIVARIIKAHKGNIEIQSELNQYTIVTVTIPLTDDSCE
ncbi:MAG: DUF3365 domain-containing protein, partial [Mucispirillum sp.]|nr:DUF3365 domain-containing protein [Mucispirillum sp.]